MQPATETLSPQAAGSRQHRRWFYPCMGMVATLVVVASFGGSYYGIAMGTGTLPRLVKIHAAIFALWLVLFIAQALLVATKKVAVHRRLGMAAVALAAAMIALGYKTAVAEARRGFALDGSNDSLAYLVFPLGSIVGFTALTAGGLWYRRRPEVHKRLMLLATVGPLMNAPLAHLFAHTPMLQGKPLLFLIVMAALLFAGAIGLFVWGNLQAVAIGPSGWWHRFAAWVVS